MRPRIHGSRPYVCIARSNSAAACGKSPLRRLRDYYMGEGASDSVIIDLPRGDMCPSFARLPAAEASRGMRLADHLPQSCPGSGWERAHCANRLPPKAADRNEERRVGKDWVVVVFFS